MYIILSCTIIIDQLPTLEELLVLKYTNNGEQKKLRIINEACHKWRDIANLICSDANIVRVLEQTYRDNPSECLKRIFIDYFINKEPRGYFQDWNGVLKLLDDIKFCLWLWYNVFVGGALV